MCQLQTSSRIFTVDGMVDIMFYKMLRNAYIFLASEQERS